MASWGDLEGELDRWTEAGLLATLWWCDDDAAALNPEIERLLGLSETYRVPLHLATIPRDLFDASRVDGANEWKMFWTVTFWRLLPVTLVLVVLRFGTAMAVIDEYLIMGGFMRDRPTYTWTVYMWDTAFQGAQDRGYAAAIGWVGTIVMLAVVAILFWAFRSRD